MRWMRLLFTLMAGLVLAAALRTGAQEAAPLDPAVCGVALEALWTAASDACIGTPSGFICNGGAAPQAEPAGAINNALASFGALVETGVVQSLHTLPISVETDSVGVAWMRLPPPIPVTALLLGDVSIWNVSPPDFPAWQSSLVITGAQPSTCLAAPLNVLVVQSPFNQPVPIVINGASIALNGTVLVRTIDTSTVFVSLSGQSSVTVYGQSQPLFPGEQVIVPYAPGDFSRPINYASAPMPYDLTLVRNLPVPLLDRPVIVPQPGIVATQGEVNLRSSPSTDAGVITLVPAGEVMSVLGSNPSGTWYHVRLDTGETGWMFAELLRRSVGAIQTTYDATPMPPQRYGDLGKIGRVLAPAGVHLRVGPDATFPVVGSVANGTPVMLVARSPYSPWIKVEAGGMIGWVALITIDTKAFIDALPIDFTVPPLPTPTPIPGSFGNAFPDPNNN